MTVVFAERQQAFILHHLEREGLGKIHNTIDPNSTLGFVAPLQPPAKESGERSLVHFHLLSS